METKISNVNNKPIRRKKIQRRNRFVALLVGFGLFSTADMIVDRAEARNDNRVIPSGYTEYYSKYSIDVNDNVYDIAEKFWVDELYEDYYFTLDNYVKEIGRVNDINIHNITPYQDIIVPTLVEEQNIYLQQINFLNESLKNLDRWVQYEVNYGDTILSLAYYGAGDTNEAYVLKDEISKRNGGNDIYAGQTISIINPEIGAIKKEIKRYEELLNKSLEQNNNHVL